MPSSPPSGREPEHRGAAVVLSPVTPGLREAVLALAPRPEQEPFSGRADQTLPVAEQDPRRTPVVVLEDGRPVGFFVLDRTPSPADPGADLVLRAFFVDAREQGRGIAKAAVAALPGLVAERFPDVASVVLTVNVRNPAARAVYLSGGFVDTGERYLGGSAGPQHVLRLELAAAAGGSGTIRA